jgi:hypothetical protein
MLRFIIAIHNKGGLELGGHYIKLGLGIESNKEAYETCKMDLAYLLQVEELFQLLNFPTNTDVSMFTKQDQRLIQRLIITLLENKEITITETMEHSYTLFTPQLQQYRFAFNIILQDTPDKHTVKIVLLADYRKPPPHFAYYIEENGSSYYHLYNNLSAEDKETFYDFPISCFM